MNPILKNSLAVLAGIVIGSAVNMALITQSVQIIPLPEGVDPSNPESLKENIHLFEARHYVVPFLAHALGTLVGAFVAAKIATTRKMTFAYALGIWFLIGGILNVYMLNTPLLPSIIDLVLAYFPFAWLGGKIATR